MTSKTKTNAYLILPHLVYVAQQRQLITYGELAEKAGLSHHRPIPRALGFIRDNFCLPHPDIPMLNAIVINQGTEMPGESYLPEGSASLTKQERIKAFEKHRDEVFAYQGWDDLLEELGLSPIEKKTIDLDQEGHIYTKRFQDNRSQSEKEAHQQLKNFVAAHPTYLGLYTKKTPVQEYLFIAGDKCDVVFDLDLLGMAVIEIKNGKRGELIKGIYQAIKYRALMQAEKGHGQEYSVQAFLVAYKIPKEIETFANQFGIKCKVIDQEKVQKFFRHSA